MKELDSFTVERLEEWINTPEKYDHRYSPRINCDELRALARIALAAKRDHHIVECTEKVDSPEIPEGWISIPRDMLADYRDVKNAEVENYKAGFAGYYDLEGTRWARDFADLCEELTAIDKVLAAAPEKP